MLRRPFPYLVYMEPQHPSSSHSGTGVPLPDFMGGTLQCYHAGAGYRGPERAPTTDETLAEKEATTQEAPARMEPKQQSYPEHMNVVRAIEMRYKKYSFIMYSVFTLSITAAVILGIAYDLDFRYFFSLVFGSIGCMLFFTTWDYYMSSKMKSEIDAVVTQFRHEQLKPLDHSWMKKSKLKKDLNE